MTTLTIDLKIDGGNDLDLNLSPINLNLSPINVLPLQVNLGIIEVKPLQVNLGPIEVRPIDFTLRIKEIPSVRVRLPMDYKVCVNLLGHELASVRLCGQGQIITEPYFANPCECRPARIVSNAVALSDEVDAVSAG